MLPMVQESQIQSKYGLFIMFRATQKKVWGFQVFTIVPKGPWEALKMELKLSFVFTGKNFIKKKIQNSKSEI